MAKNHVQEGKIITWTNSTGSAVASGATVIIGTMIGVALVDIANAASGSVAIGEVFDIGKTAGLAITLGAQIYVNSSTKLATVTNTDVPGGRAIAAAAAGDSTVSVLLNCNIA